MTGDTIAASIVHEVQQPLAAMITNAYAGLRFLDRPMPDLDEAKEAFQQIVAGGHRAAAVIRSIRGLFKTEGRNRVSFETTSSKTPSLWSGRTWTVLDAENVRSPVRMSGTGKRSGAPLRTAYSPRKAIQAIPANARLRRTCQRTPARGPFQTPWGFESPVAAPAPRGRLAAPPPCFQPAPAPWPAGNAGK